MKMMKNMRISAAALLVSIVLSGCDDWMEPESKQIFAGTTENTKSEEYYANLRAYKESEHAIAFGWFAWSGAPGAELLNSFTGMPDSLDLVSLWAGPGGGMTPEMTADLRRVQELKGTKIVICTFIQDVGQGCTPPEHSKDQVGVAGQKEYWGWVDGDDEAIRASLQRYAKGLADRVIEGGWDGLDIDYEPTVDAYASTLDDYVRNGERIYVRWLLEELSTYLGPQSGSGKLLIVDGQINQLPKSVAPYLDYFIRQTYTQPSPPYSMSTVGTEASKNSDLASTINYLKDEANGIDDEYITNRYITTENLEYGPIGGRGGWYWRFIEDSKNTSNNSADGGNAIAAPINEYPSLRGHALWQPSNGFRKGGFGGYHFESGRPGTPSYKWMRLAIQDQNPAQTVTESND